MIPLILLLLDGCRVAQPPLTLESVRTNDVLIVRDVKNVPVELWRPLEERVKARKLTVFIGTHPFEGAAPRDLRSIPLTGNWQPEPVGTISNGFVRFENFQDWNYVSLDGLRGIPGNTLVFTAGGDTNTSRLVIMAVEEDGAHWHHVFSVTPQPQSFIVHESQFQYFYGGRKRDHLELRQLKKLSFGLSMHLAPQSPGSHTFTLTNLGTSATAFVEPPDIPMLSPSYRHYDLPDGSQSPIACSRARWMPIESAEHGWPVSKYDQHVWIAKDNPSDATVSNTLAALSQLPGVPRLLPLPETSDEWVTVDGAYFSYRGERLFLKGVNYWPLNHNGKAPGEYHPFWLEPEGFDPEIVIRDLDRLQQMGVNAVAIQYHEPSQAPQLRWFVNACRQRGIWVNCFVGYLQPLDQNLEKAKRLIEAAGFKDMPGVFAFDIAWEPHLGNYAQRCRFDGEWEKWILEKYGSVDQAEEVIGRPLWNRDGHLTGPPDHELSTDGSHRGAVAAYRRFVDDFMGRRYGEVKEFVRDLGCRQLLSARSGYGGNGNHWADPLFPLDLMTGAEYFDFISPEGYALTGNLDQFYEGGFITAYARATGKPVVWMEYGVSVGQNPLPPDLENQARLYRNMLEMVTRSHAAGCFAWWYPGGWRVDERSDYGIVNLDGSLRPAAKVLKNFQPRTQSPRPWNGRMAGRFSDARGLSGLWDKWREIYRKEMAEDRMEEVRIETATLRE